MENKDLVSFQVSAEMVNAIAEKQITAAIVASLGNTEEFVNSIIISALHRKVDCNGNISSYSSDNKYDFLDIALKKAIATAADESIKEWVDKNKKDLKEKLKKLINLEKNKKQIIKSFLDAGLSNIDRWNFKCNTNINLGD